MIITRSNVFFHLLQLGLTDSKSVVNSDLLIQDRSIRNRNFVVSRRHAPGYFVKQTADWNSRPRKTLAREAEACRLAGQVPDLSGGVPHLHHYDRAREILVLELVPGETLREYYHQCGTLDHAIADQLGWLMAQYQTAFATVVNAGKLPAAFPGQLPWVLKDRNLGQTLAQGPSQGQAGIGEILKYHPDLQASLDQLRERWQPTTIIHGDIKLDNCLWRLPSAGRHSRMVLSDWELADVGDPAWDIAAVFASHLSLWMAAAGKDQATKLGVRSAGLAFPFPAVRTFLRHFWESYTRAAALDQVLTEALLVRSARLTGARLILSAYESLWASASVTPAAVLQLQASQNILTNPQALIDGLFGEPANP